MFGDIKIEKNRSYHPKSPQQLLVSKKISSGEKFLYV